MKNLSNVLEKISKKNQGGSQYLKLAENVLAILDPVAEKHPKWIKSNIFECFLEPEREIVFRVPWIDDNGNVQVNRGFRVQFNSAIGPYNGCIRFHPLVDIDIIRTCALEQTLKNALTGLPIGGASGGSDFDPKGKSEGEIMRFCQSFMTSLYRYIGENTDILRGDVGVGHRELSFMFGQYKRLKNEFTGIITGKAGITMSTKTIGYGMGYFMSEALASKGRSFKDAVVVISGLNNDAIYTTKKMEHLGAKVVTLSDANGYIYDPDGIKRSTIKKIKGLDLSEYAKFHSNAKYVKGCSGLWDIKCDVAFSCAAGNEIDPKAAKTLAANGCIAVGEVIENEYSKEIEKIFRENNIIFAPPITTNVGDDILSALEMSQISMRQSLTFQEIELKLKNTMTELHKSISAANKEFGIENDLRAGAIIVAFLKIADAMYAQGIS